jgi:hypothetical protein
MRGGRGSSGFPCATSATALPHNARAMAENFASCTASSAIRPGLDAEGVETGMFEVPPAGAAISRSNASSSRSAYARTNMSYIAKTTGLTEVIPLRIEQFPVRIHARYSD